MTRPISILFLLVFFTFLVITPVFADTTPPAQPATTSGAVSAPPAQPASTSETVSSSGGMNLHAGAQNALTLIKEWLPFIIIASVIMSLFRKERGLGYAISVILLGAVLMFLTEPAMLRGLGHAVVAFLTGTAK